MKTFSKTYGLTEFNSWGPEKETQELVYYIKEMFNFWGLKFELWMTPNIFDDEITFEALLSEADYPPKKDPNMPIELWLKQLMEDDPCTKN